MKRICTICARGGSKGVPNKNVRIVVGKPLIAHSLAQAIRSNAFEIIAVSTDSEQIASIARQYGAQMVVTRPPDLASDTAAKLPAIRHCVESVERELNTQFDTIVDLDVTSPLRTSTDIIECIRLIEEHGASNVVTAMEARRSPYFNMLEIDEAGSLKMVKTSAQPISRRQDAPKCFDMNASIYAWQRSALLEQLPLIQPRTRLYVMPEERSIDIDSDVDLRLVEVLAEQRGEL